MSEFKGCVRINTETVSTSYRSLEKKSCLIGWPASKSSLGNPSSRLFLFYKIISRRVWNLPSGVSEHLSQNTPHWQNYLKQIITGSTECRAGIQTLEMCLPVVAIEGSVGEKRLHRASGPFVFIFTSP